MATIRCPSCDSVFETAGDFETHMDRYHPPPRAALGFGHTLFP